MRFVWLSFLRPWLQSVKVKVFPRPSVQLGEGYLRKNIERSGVEIEQLAREAGYSIKMRDPFQNGVHLHHSFADRFVWRLSEAVFVTRTGVLLVDGRAIVESTSNGRVRSGLLSRIGLCWPIREKIVFCVAQPKWNYYHWFVEDFPRLLKALEVQQSLTVLIGRTPPIFVIQSLRALRVPYRVARFPCVSVSQAILASRGLDAGWANKADVQIVRHFFGIGEASGSDRIFISRRRSSRAFANEEQLEQFLQGYGFSVVYAENLSLEEQKTTFERASVIVGNHGAGLTNIIFTPPSCLLVEIVVASRANQIFERLCLATGNPYRRVTVEETNLFEQGRLSEEDFAAVLQAIVGEH